MTFLHPRTFSKKFAVVFLLAVVGDQLSMVRSAAKASVTACLFQLGTRQLAMEEEGGGAALSNGEDALQL